MFRRKREPDAMSLTMAAVQAAARQDIPAMLTAGQNMEALSAQQVFGALGNFFSGMSSAMTPEYKAIVRTELDAAHGPEGVHAAVLDIGTALMIDCDGKEAGAAVVRHATKLANQDGQWAGVIWETVEAAGRACGRIGVQFNWKGG
jgi:hypothetical protein